MIKWKQVLLKSSDTIKEAIQILNREIPKIVIVTNKEDMLLGTVTDGDIRRSLIKQCGLDTKLVDIMQKNPLSASIEDDQNLILEMMKSKSVRQVPIVDAYGRVVGLETLQSLSKNKKVDNPVILMAGGFGKRLQPLTDETPKPLLKIGSKPILETIIDNFAKFGFHNFFISTHYKAEMLREYFGDGSQWGVNIQYIHEDKPLGTAGVLGLLSSDFSDLPILMMNGDLVTKVNYKQLLNFHKEQGGLATMCVREYDFQVPYGVIQSTDCRLTSIIEKPTHKFFVNAGIYVLEPPLVDSLDGSSFVDMPCLLEKQIEKGEQVNTFPLHEYWLDIGRIEEFERANKEYIAQSRDESEKYS